MNRLGKTLEAFLTNSNTKKRIIVSTYNAYEWISTYNCRSMFLLKFAYYLMGYKVYGKDHACDAFFEWFDPKKDQITYHSPYDDFL